MTPTDMPVAPIEMPTNRMSDGQVDQRRAAAAARGGGPDLLGQPELGEPGDLGGDGRAGDLEPVGELRLRQRALVAQLGEQPGLHRALGPTREGMTHGGS